MELLQRFHDEGLLSGGPVLSSCRCHDRASQEQIQLLHTILEQMAEGVLVADSEGRFTFFNQQAERLLGSRPDLPPDQWSGHYGTHQLEERGELQPVPAHRVPLYRALRGERIDNEEYFLCRTGIWLSINSRPLTDIEGRPLGAVSVCRDITDLKQAEAERKKLEAQLMVSDLMYSLGTLAAGVGHEINNPLSVVTMNLEMALKETKTASGEVRVEALQEMLGEARAAARRVSRIVRDLKMFSRPEVEEMTTVDLHELLESTARMVANEIRPRAAFVQRFAAGSPCVRAVESRLGQVFLNLLLNAAQAIPEGRPDANTISLTTSLEDGGILVAVSDTGSGIEPEVVAQVFRPFFTTKPVGEGTGLGLSLSHQIVTGLGGSLTVETQVGEGSTFLVRLPTVASSARLRRPVARQPEGLTRGRVLAVDDEASVCRYLRRALSSDHEVDACGDGLAALERIRQGERYDVIISDLTMPRMTGMQLFEALREEAPEQAERMIFLTGGAFTARARAFLDETSNVVLHKPCRLEQLRAAVAQRLLANVDETPGQ